MLKNFLKIALRSLLKHKLYTGISLIGLIVGLTCCLLAFFYVKDELQYDAFHQDAPRIYRVALERIYPDHRSFFATIPSSFAPAISREMPEVATTLRMWKSSEPILVRKGESTFEESGFVFADSTFFRLFSFHLVAGDPQTVLRQPRSVVLTQTAAQKYFGSENALGKTLQTDFGTLSVTGICRDAPQQSHFDFDMVASWQAIPFPVPEPNYMYFNAYTYLLLNPGADARALEAKLPTLVQKYASGQIERQLGVSYAAYQAAGNGYRYFLQPLSSIHLQSHLEGELGTNGSLLYVSIFVLTAVLLLFIAVMNTINLTTARSMSRAREVGIRKVLGAEPVHIGLQFLLESTLLCLISALFAAIAARLMLPLLNDWAGKSVQLNWQEAGYTLVGLFLLTLGAGVASGVYPAFVMAAFRPLQVLKGRFNSSAKGIWLRNGLVGFQFFVSTSLLIGMLVVFRQVQFMREGNAGFTKERVMILNRVDHLTDSLADRRQVLRQHLEGLPQVQMVGMGNPVPGRPSFGFQFRSAGKNEVFTLRGMIAEEHLIRTLGIKMTAGRGFSRHFTDTYSLLLNQTAVKELGLKDAVGKQLQMVHPSDSSQNRPYTIVGILEDFHFQSLHESITPLAVLHTSNPLAFTPFMAIKLHPGAVPEAVMGKVKAIWRQVAPDQPFSYSYLEQDWNRLYQQEQRWGELFTFFAVVTLLLACGGLYGLAAFLVHQRRREVSVRKLFGAASPHLFLLLSKRFVNVVLVAVGLAAVVIHFAIRQWLSSFAYRVSLRADVYVIPIGLILLLTLVTISYHLVKTIRTNPATALREE